MPTNNGNLYITQISQLKEKRPRSPAKESCFHLPCTKKKYKKKSAITDCVSFVWQIVSIKKKKERTISNKNFKKWWQLLPSESSGKIFSSWWRNESYFSLCAHSWKLVPAPSLTANFKDKSLHTRYIPMLLMRMEKNCNASDSYILCKAGIFPHDPSHLHNTFTATHFDKNWSRQRCLVSQTICRSFE